MVDMSEKVTREGNLILIDIPVDYVRTSSPSLVRECLKQNGIDITKPYETVQLCMQFKVRYVQVSDKVLCVDVAEAPEDYSVEKLIDFSKMKKDDLIAECVRLGMSEDMDLSSFTKTNLIDLIVSYKDATPDVGV